MSSLPSILRTHQQNRDFENAGIALQGAWTENILKTKLSKNDDIRDDNGGIFLSQFFSKTSNTNSKLSLIDAFSNPSREVWSKNI